MDVLANASIPVLLLLKGFSFFFRSSFFLNYVSEWLEAVKKQSNTVTIIKLYTGRVMGAYSTACHDANQSHTGMTTQRFSKK